MNGNKIHIAFFTLLAILSGCKKSDEVKSDARLDRPYCNNPQAINYNWDFPGEPDSSICIFPTWVFRGTYNFIDSVYDSDSKLKRTTPLTLSLVATSNTTMYLKGLCSSGDSITMTADRFYKSHVDSFNIKYNTQDIKLNGQYFCNSKDTVSGTITKDKVDSTKITVFFTVASDSGIFYHRGTGIKK